MEVFLKTTREGSNGPSVGLADCGGGDGDESLGGTEAVVEKLISVNSVSYLAISVC